MKARRLYVCQSCGHREPKWLGRCPTCSEWSSLVEELISPASGPSRAPRSETKALPLAEVKVSEEARATTGIPELDRVLGGGLVHGSLVLVGGDPGIGKSTLLLQAVGHMAARGQKALYVSAEESMGQVKLRAERLGIRGDTLFLLPETHLEAVDRAREQIRPAVMVIDSVQTIGLAGLESPVGSVSQIRGVTHRLMDIAKGDGVSTFVVGHVTKEGAIAGPKVMEHIVDTVLYFEGERTGPYRLLRAHKNRFGSAQEIGVFEMHSEGLRGVSNPSELFLSQRAKGPGAVVVSSVEGSRPILLEVQALTTPSLYGNPRRTTQGFDPQRVSMLCAILERHAGLGMAGLDVYVNIAGGVRVSEPAADLGVMLALASAASGSVLPDDTVVVGEVGLSGEVRAVCNLPSRVQEANALGFSRVLVPQVELERWHGPPAELPLCGAASVQEALTEVGLATATFPSGHRHPPMTTRTN